MRLSELKLDKNRIISDGEFNHFGFMNSEIDGKLFVHYGDKRYKKQLENHNITCVICSEKLVHDLPTNIKGIYISDDSKYDYFDIFAQFGDEGVYDDFETRIGSNCVISDKANIADRNVIIGDNCVVEAFATINENSILENGVTIRSNSVIGTPGLQIVRDNGGLPIMVKHFGGVKICEGSMIYSMVSIERALFKWDKTIIGNHTFINSFSTVGHACKIGNRTLVASGMKLGGFSTIGDDVWIGIGASIRHQTRIGNRSQVMMGSIIRKNIDDDMVVVGDRIIPKEKYNKMQKIISH